ncbi:MULTISPECIES: DUF554 domain-containing protein [unclassified Planococcus (in: firmicutes)]|uniref:DUF554 domain-containing protein n=1 Tax=unclassified Planococcus (in: firmicutes) TaxID=2662419 RepID=UPI001F1CC4CE|nr:MULTISPECIES: DUF554 domain-containing protein [unclassified Planococcus (in: firmicutes)]UJF26932.1 DUF554 domain-containing protein [Planococcus sp. 107-1]GKW46157.1 membrane protein [Planococcus sp. NCCP-2050]
MVLLGTLVNAILIVVGTLIGRALRNIPEKMKETVMYVIGLAVVVLGLQMGLESQNFIVVIISLVFGAVIGEWMNLDKKLNDFGRWIEVKLGAKESKDSIAQGFVTATLIFVIGAMGIIGALESGLSNEHGVLISKGLIDGFTSIILASTLGIGVLLAAIPVFVYQGLIALFATQISLIVPEAALDMFITEMTATGGVMIVAIGLNLMGLTKMRVANLLPGVIVVGLIVTVMFKMNLG